MKTIAWLLLIYMTGPHKGGFDAIEFNSENTCLEAQVVITEWIEEQAFFVIVRSVCMSVEK